VKLAQATQWNRDESRKEELEIKLDWGWSWMWCSQRWELWLMNVEIKSEGGNLRILQERNFYQSFWNFFHFADRRQVLYYSIWDSESMKAPAIWNLE